MWGYPDVPGAAALSMILVLILAIVVTPMQVYMARMDQKNA
jgi:iron(III) transport system permease protein